MTQARQHAIAIWMAGLDAVRAKPLVMREINVETDVLEIGGHVFVRSDFDRVIVVGAGKAASAMAEGLVERLGNGFPVLGWVNVPEGTETSIKGVVTHPARPAGINEPTEAGIIGSIEIMRLVESATDRDLVIALISGGGSALLPLPAEGISLADKLAVTRHLSGSGATIDELNTVRKHLSRIKGGGLLRACRAGQLVTLVLSDVLGDPLDLIASGPTVPDTSTAEQAIEVLRTYDSDAVLPQSVYRVLANAKIDEATQHCQSTVVVLGNNAVAVDEAGIVAEQLGYNHVMQSATSSEGLAEALGQQLAELVVEMLRSDPAAHRHDCLITGGEPTVQLCPPDIRGRGGRNQQLVLAAYQRLLELQISEADWDRLAILSGGTDGEDGPTDAAGAFIDAQVHRSATEQHLDINDHLRRNNAYEFFQACGGLLTTGPTGTNVCDVRVALVTAQSGR